MPHLSCNCKKNRIYSAQLETDCSSITDHADDRDDHSNRRTHTFQITETDSNAHHLITINLQSWPCNKTIFIRFSALTYRSQIFRPQTQDQWITVAAATTIALQKYLWWFRMITLQVVHSFVRFVMIMMMMILAYVDDLMQINRPEYSNMPRTISKASINNEDQGWGWQLGCWSDFLDLVNDRHPSRIWSQIPSVFQGIRISDQLLA